MPRRPPERGKEEGTQSISNSPLPPRFPSKQGAKNSNGEKEVLLFYQPRSFVRSRGSDAHSERGKERERIAALVQSPFFSPLSPSHSPPPPFSPPKIEFSFVGGGGGGGRGRHLREKFFVGGYSSSSSSSSLLSLSENSAGPPPPPTLHLPLTGEPPPPRCRSPPSPVSSMEKRGERRRWISSFLEIPATSGRDEEGPVTLPPPLLLTHGKRRVHDGPHLSQLTSHESAQRFLSRDGPLRVISIPFPPFLCMNGR